MILYVDTARQGMQGFLPYHRYQKDTHKLE